MKAAVIFMLSAALILVFCFTTQGRKSSGRTSSIVIRTDHGGGSNPLDSSGFLPCGRKHVVCIWHQKKPHNLQSKDEANPRAYRGRKRRHMSAHRRHGHRRRACARNCLKKRAPGRLAVPIPLT